MLVNSLKSIFKKTIPYRTFLRIVIYSYYNISLLFKINKNYRFFTKKKFNILFEKGYMFCPYEIKHKSLRNKDFDKFANRMLLFTKTKKCV